jgi:subtilisin family serine protease
MVAPKWFWLKNSLFSWVLFTYTQVWAAPMDTGSVPGEVLITLKTGTVLTSAAEPFIRQSREHLLARLQAKYDIYEDRPRPGGPVAHHLAHRRLLFKTRGNVNATCAALKNDPDVLSAQPNYIYRLCKVPNDPDFADQYAHRLIQMPDAWEISTGSNEVVVAVLDTGVDIDHPDLKDNIWVNAGEIPDNDVDDDENGYVDDTHGWNVERDTNHIEPDRNWGDSSVINHGTLVSGVIAATGDNGEGVVGVNWRCRIMVVRLSPEITSAEVAKALDYASENGAHVANMSFGSDAFGPKGDPLVREALDRAHECGMLLVASAGNADTIRPSYPAAHYHVMAVSSTNGEDTKTGHSSFGPWVDIAAPGTDIVTTDLDGAYLATAGTSFSSPYVAAVGALVLSHRPELTSMEVRAILENTTDAVDYGALDSNAAYLGTGRVNAYQALMRADENHPLAEIVEPGQNAVFDQDVNVLDIALLVHGEYYCLDYRAYEDQQWVLAAEGDCPVDSHDLVRVSLPNPGISAYVLRLRVITEGHVHTDRKEIRIQVAAQQPPWPFSQSTDYFPDKVFYGSPLCLDVDGDRRNELVQSSFMFDDVGSQGIIDLWDEHGHSLPGWPVSVDDTYEFNCAVGDVDGDGAYEVVGTSYYDNSIHVWRVRDGMPLAGDWPQFVGDWLSYMVGLPVLADLDGDGDSEIIVGLDDTSGESGGLFAFRADGTPLWQRRYALEGGISVADMDADGDVEMALSGYGSGMTRVHTYLLDHQGQTIRRWQGGSKKAVVIADLEGDQVHELIFCTDQGIRAVHVDGSTLWFADVHEPLEGLGAISIGDIDSDGYNELYVHNHRDSHGYVYGRIHAFDHQGHEFVDRGFPKTIIGDARDSVPLIVDVDGDNEKELVVASGGASVMAWERDGSVTPGFPLFGISCMFQSSPALKDLDQDGDLEMMLAGEDYQFHVLDFPGQVDTTGIEWGSNRLDPQNSGWLANGPMLDDLPIPDQIEPGQMLRIAISATHPDCREFRLSTGNLPEGAFFDANLGVLFWKPTLEQAFQTHTFSYSVTDGVKQDSQSLSVSVVPSVIYYANMDENPSWQLDSGWKWGVPNEHGSLIHDPNFRGTGLTVVGYALEGEYGNDLQTPRYATTGQIACAGFRTAYLSYWRWLTLESPFDQASVQGSNDGVIWTDLWTPGQARTVDSGWQYIEHALPSALIIGQSTLYFRWGIGPTDDTVTYSGWNIDDVLVTGERLDLGLEL